MSDNRTNEDRASSASQCIQYYMEITGSEPETALADLLCDLKHFAQQNGEDFHDSLETADTHFEAELEDADTSTSERQSNETTISLSEAGDGEGQDIEMKVSADFPGVWFGFSGYGSCCEEGDQAPIVVFEQYNNELGIRIYGDINSEEPTHNISLESARHGLRKDF